MPRMSLNSIHIVRDAELPDAAQHLGLVEPHAEQPLGGRLVEAEGRLQPERRQEVVEPRGRPEGRVRRLRRSLGKQVGDTKTIVAYFTKAPPGAPITRSMAVGSAASLWPPKFSNSKVLGGWAYRPHRHPVLPS